MTLPIWKTQIGKRETEAKKETVRQQKEQETLKEEHKTSELVEEAIDKAAKTRLEEMERRNKDEVKNEQDKMAAEHSENMKQTHDRSESKGGRRQGGAAKEAIRRTARDHCKANCTDA